MTTSTDTERLPRVDFINRIIQRRTGIPEWQWFRAEWIDENMIVTGGVPTVGKQGKKKWNRKTAERKIIILAELEKEHADYERETGLCSNCYGNGSAISGWSKETGNRYKQCANCGGTGRANNDNR